MKPSRHPAGTAFRQALQVLACEGWAATTPAPALGGILSTTMTCPAKHLALTVQVKDCEGAIVTAISTLLDGAGAPAHWCAVTHAPPPNLWLQAARAASRAASGLDIPPNPFPLAALRHLGWSHTELYSEGRWSEHAQDRARGRAVLYTRPTRATPGTWSIVRPDATITIEVRAPDHLALPALILALAQHNDDNDATADTTRD